MRPRPLQTRQSPRTEAASIETFVFPMVRSRAPLHSLEVIFCGGSFFVAARRFLPTTSILLRSVAYRQQLGKVRFGIKETRPGRSARNLTQSSGADRAISLSTVLKMKPSRRAAANLSPTTELVRKD